MAISLTVSTYDQSDGGAVITSSFQFITRVQFIITPRPVTVVPKAQFANYHGMVVRVTLRVASNPGAGPISHSHALPESPSW